MFFYEIAINYFKMFFLIKITFILKFFFIETNKWHLSEEDHFITGKFSHSSVLFVEKNKNALVC